jgi:BolA protein
MLIEKKLQDCFNPIFLEVVDNSIFHKGHAENLGGEETHFSIKIASEELSKMKKIDSHRKINQLLKEEFNNGVHALEIKIL